MAITVVTSADLVVDVTPPAENVITVETGNTATTANIRAAVPNLVEVASPANDDMIQRVGGSWVTRTIAQVKTALGLGSAAYTASTAYATAAQGATADAAETPAGAQAKADAKVTDAIANGTTTVAPSQNAVFDALALKADALGVDDNYVTDVEKTKLGNISVTQPVDLDDIETRVNNLDAAVVLKGVWDASAGTFPGAGIAQAGFSYIVTVAGTVDSVAFNIGDRAIAILDNASTTTFAANWFKADYTDQVLSVCGRTGAVTIASADITDATNAATASMIVKRGTAGEASFAVVNGSPAVSGSASGNGSGGNFSSATGTGVAGVSISGTGAVILSDSGTGATIESDSGVHLNVGVGKFIIANNGNVTGTGTFAASNLSGTNTGDETGARIATLITAATSKATPVDADEIPLADSAASFGLKKLTWANLKATAKTYFDSLYLGLDATEVSISGAITLTSTAFGKIHVCSGTSADYTVGLPAVSGNAGKIISFRMSSALTKLVTLDGNASELIGDATTRIMWANETAILSCDGTAWTKLAGTSIPMKARAALATAGAAAQAVAASTTVVVNLTATESDSTGTMSDLVNNRLICRRAGTYTMFAAAVWDDGAGWAATRIISRIRKNGTTDIAATETNKLSGGYPANTPATSVNLALGDYVEVTVYQTNASSRNLYGDSLCYISMQEVVTW
jgi:hypothetical protein